jgi:hypothetical protein
MVEKAVVLWIFLIRLSGLKSLDVNTGSAGDCSGAPTPVMKKVGALPPSI